MSQPNFRIHAATCADDFADSSRLFTAYASSIGIDLGYQDFATECATLPGSYSPPSGALLLAWGAGAETLGCVALRPLARPGECEMKRLYVTPAGRGLGIGRALVDSIIGVSIAIGYRLMRLDTLPTMENALALYRKAGFAETAPYYDTPVKGTIFLARRLP